MRRLFCRFVRNEEGALTGLTAILMLPLVVLMLAPSEFSLYQHTRAHQEAATEVAATAAIQHFVHKAPEQPDAPFNPWDPGSVALWDAFFADLEEAETEARDLLAQTYAINRDLAPPAYNESEPALREIIFERGDYLSSCAMLQWDRPARFRILSLAKTGNEGPIVSQKTTLAFLSEDQATDRPLPISTGIAGSCR